MANNIFQFKIGCGKGEEEEKCLVKYVTAVRQTLLFTQQQEGQQQRWRQQQFCFKWQSSTPELELLLVYMCGEKLYEIVANYFCYMLYVVLHATYNMS